MAVAIGMPPVRTHTLGIHDWAFRGKATLGGTSD